MTAEITETEMTDKYGESRYYDFNLKELFCELKKEFPTAEYIYDNFFDDPAVITITGKFGYFNLEKSYGSMYFPDLSLQIEISGVSERDNKGRLIKYYALNQEIERKICQNYLSKSIKFIKEHMHILDDESYFTNRMQ